MYFKHGHSKVGKRSAEYDVWKSARRRCQVQDQRAWKDYGGRGIKMCERWASDFLEFYKDVGPRPSPKHSLDRIDNDGNYEPGNVRWVEWYENAENRRSSVYTREDCFNMKKLFDLGMKQSAIARLYDVNQGTIFYCIKRCERLMTKTSDPSSLQITTEAT